jgi:enediyne biosynthesis protein E2
MDAMASVLGTMRRFVFTPSFDKVTFDGRGFLRPPAAVATALESIPQSVILGFEFGIACPGLPEIERRLLLLAEDLRGFGYEGATMALTIRDVMGGGKRRLTERLLRGPGAPHTFLAFIGIGFAMARLPRRLWAKVVPDLTGVPYFPAMTWLAVDGYGFDRAYFDTKRWLRPDYRPSPYPWQGEPEYFLRVLDQGFGRALWFIHGADTDRVVEALRRFPAARHADLWSGVGLAAAFAGGAEQASLEKLGTISGEYLPEVAQGAVFAAKARVQAGNTTPHTEMAVRAWCGMSMTEASALADESSQRAVGERIPYEAWRQNTRRYFAR